MTTKSLLIFRFIFFLLVIQCSSATNKPSIEANKNSEYYDEWAGLSSASKNLKHNQNMDLSWGQMLVRRNEISKFLQNNKYEVNQKTVVYPFSGIDVLNLITFFPKSDRYVLFGLEDPGYPFDWEIKNHKEKNVILEGIENLSSHLAGRNYFTYRKMKEETKKPALSGAYPVFVAFLRRLGKEIIDTKSEMINGQVNSYYGFTIVMYDPILQKNQTLTYFKIFLTGKEGIPGDGLYEYFSNLGEKAIFTKSAEYLFHGERRSTFRNLLLKDTKEIVQDDSGFPLRLFPDTDWTKTLYGKYDKSWNLSGAVEPESQSEMKLLNERFKNEPLPFPFGYGVLGSKDVSKSVILVIKKKTN